MGFPGGSAGKESACDVGDLGLIPGLGRSPEEGNSYPLQYSGLERSMDCMYSPWGRKESDTTEQLSLRVGWRLTWSPGAPEPCSQVLSSVLLEICCCQSS